MSNHMDLNSIAPGQIAWVRGKIQFCRLTRYLAGDELKRDIQNQMQNRRTRFPTTDPYLAITIDHAGVVYANPQAATDFEQYIAAKALYLPNRTVVNGQPTQGYFCEAQIVDPKMLRKPTYLDASDGKTAKEFVPEGELAKGLDVTLVFHTFKSKNSGNMGFACDTIIVNEPPRYYESNVASAIASRGLTYQPMNADEKAAALEKQKANAETAAAQPAEPYATENPYPSYPQAPANGFQPAPPQSGGITWDPNQRNY